MCATFLMLEENLAGLIEALKANSFRTWTHHEAVIERGIVGQGVFDLGDELRGGEGAAVRG